MVSIELKRNHRKEEFAETVNDTTNLISINNFAKSTYGVLGLGQKKLFKELRYFNILNRRNKPYQSYINAGYFKVITRTCNGKLYHQPMLTGKGEIWLLNKMKTILDI